MSSVGTACLYIHISDRRGRHTQNGHRNGHTFITARFNTAVGSDGGHLAVRLQCAARERACSRGAETRLDSDGVGVHGGQNLNVYAHFSPAFSVSKRPRERFCHRGAVP